MLLTLAIILFVIWLVGWLAFHVTVWAIHLALIVGIILLIAHFVGGGRPAAPPPATSRQEISGRRRPDRSSNG